MVGNFLTDIRWTDHHGSGNCSAAQLAVRATLPLEVAYSQALFTKFLRYFVRHPDTRHIEGHAKVQGMQRLPESWENIQLRNKAFTELVTAIHRTGLGTEEEIYLCMIPALSEGNKLPDAYQVEKLGQERIEQFVS